MSEPNPDEEFFFGEPKTELPKLSELIHEEALKHVIREVVVREAASDLLPEHVNVEFMEFWEEETEDPAWVIDVLIRFTYPSGRGRPLPQDNLEPMMPEINAEVEKFMGNTAGRTWFAEAMTNPEKGYFSIMGAKSD